MIVFTADPLGATGIMPAWCRGEICAGNTVIAIPYNNQTTNAADLEAGVDAFDALLHSNTPPFRGFGHSRGAQLLHQWNQVKGPSSTIDPADLDFVVTGNAWRWYGGGALEHDLPAHDIRGTDYDFLDFRRQWDNWADYPTGILNFWAYWNNVFGGGIHGDYNSVAPSDTNNLSYVEGNITYMISPTSTPPLGEWARNDIEAAFNRPEGTAGGSAPPVTITPPSGVTSTVSTVRQEIEGLSPDDAQTALTAAGIGSSFENNQLFVNNIQANYLQGSPISSPRWVIFEQANLFTMQWALAA